MTRRVVPHTGGGACACPSVNINPSLSLASRSGDAVRIDSDGEGNWWAANGWNRRRAMIHVDLPALLAYLRGEGASDERRALEAADQRGDVVVDASDRARFAARLLGLM